MTAPNRDAQASGVAAVVKPLSGLDNVVIIDTNIWSQLYLTGVRSKNPHRRARYQQIQDALAGKAVVIAAQTPSRTVDLPGDAPDGLHAHEHAHPKINATPAIPFDEKVESAWVQLTALCKTVNHPLGYKEHVADRWVAATAVAYDLPLMTEDTGFAGAPLLRLFT